MMGISVVIPVRERSDYLEKLLKSIAEAKKCTSPPTEVIIIDNSEEKETRLEIRLLCKRSRTSYYYLQGGVSEARNYGIKMANFPIVLFVDSDCEVESSIFNEHLKCYNSKEIAGCLGLTEFVGKKTWFWNVIEKMPFFQPFQWARWKRYVSWGPCANISFRRDVLEKVNGFASMLPPKESGEDVELGYCITTFGYKIRCNANAKVYHTRKTWTKLSQFFERTFRFGRGEYYLMIKHAENTFLDVPKNSLLFFSLLVLFTYKALNSNTLLSIVIPFLWLLVTIFIQSLFNLKFHLIEGKWREVHFIYFASLFDFFFELSTVIEGIRKRDLKFLLYKYIYTEEQLFSRWYWGIIKMWSIVISLFFLFIYYCLFE